MDLGNIFNQVISFAVNNTVGFALSAAGTAVTGFFIWKAVDFVWEHFKPLQGFTDYAKKRANKFGLNTRDFAFKRITDEAFRNKVLAELENNSEVIQDAYVAGLRGETIG